MGGSGGGSANSLKNIVLIVVECVDVKVINGQSKKEIDQPVLVNLRIITWETVLQKALKTVLKR